MLAVLQIVCAESLLQRLSAQGACFTDCLAGSKLYRLCAGSMFHRLPVLLFHRLSVLEVCFTDCLCWESASHTFCAGCFTQTVCARSRLQRLCWESASQTVLGVCFTDYLFRILSVMGVCSTDCTGSPLYRLSVLHIVCAGSLLHSLMAERGKGGGGRQFWIGGQLRSLFS